VKRARKRLVQKCGAEGEEKMDDGSTAEERKGWGGGDQVSPPVHRKRTVRSPGQEGREKEHGASGPIKQKRSSKATDKRKLGEERKILIIGKQAKKGSAAHVQPSAFKERKNRLERINNNNE